MIPKDTSPEIYRLQLRLWMARSPQERARFAASLFRNARAVILASFPEDLSEEEVKRQLYFRTYGEHLPDDFFDR